MKYLRLLPLFALSMLFFTANAQAPASVAAAINEGEVSVIRAKLMARNGALMIDVREENEVAALAYDVEGIINIPLSQLATRMNEIPKDQDVILACTSGNRSRRATSTLQANGYTNVMNMAGGIRAWQQQDLGVIAATGTAPKASCSGSASKASCSGSATKANCSSTAGAATSCCSKGKATEGDTKNENSGH